MKKNPAANSPAFIASPFHVDSSLRSAPEPKASVWEWAQTALLAANLAWTTIGRGGYPPQVFVVTSALTAVLLVVHFLAKAFPPREVELCDGLYAPTNVRPIPSRGVKPLPQFISRRTHSAAWFFVPFLIYAAANALWISPASWLAWRDWFFWAQMIAVFTVVLNGIRSPAPQRILFFVIVALGIAGVLMACYQCFVDQDWQMLDRERSIYYRGRGSGSFGMPNSFAALLVIVLPATAALCFRRSASQVARVWWGWVTLVLLFGLVLTISRGAWIALVLAVTAWPLLAARGRWLRRVRFAAMVLGGVALLGMLLYTKSPLVRERVRQLASDVGEKTRPIMWRAAWGIFREHPIAGAGAGGYDVWFEKFRPERFNDDPGWAHNDYLNTLSDYGLVGFVLFFGACAIVVVGTTRIRRDETARRRDWLDSPTVRAALGIGLLAFGLHLVVEFHFKIPALGLIVATMGGVWVGRAWPMAAKRPAAPITAGTRAVAAMTAAFCAAGYGAFFLPQIRAENLRRPARKAINALVRVPADAAHYRAPLERARAALTRATALDPANGQAWADLSLATALWSYVETDRDAELGKIAEAAAERALGCSRFCYEFWARRGAARDLQGRWVEAGDDFGAAVKLAPTNPLAWYYYAEHLSRVYAVRESADAAAAFCLRLDPGNPLGIALRQRLAGILKAP